MDLNWCRLIILMIVLILKNYVYIKDFT